jgi:hypothetical protein
MEFLGAWVTLLIVNFILVLEMGRMWTRLQSQKRRIKALERENSELKRSFDELFIRGKK